MSDLPESRMMADLFLVRGGEVLGLQRLGHAEDAVEGRADLVGHVGEELRLGAGGGLGVLLGGAQVGLDLLPGGHVDDGADELAAVDGVGLDHLGAQLHPAIAASGDADADFLFPAGGEAVLRRGERREHEVSVFRMDAVAQGVHGLGTRLEAEAPGQRRVGRVGHRAEVDLEIAVARALDCEFQTRARRGGVGRCAACRLAEVAVGRARPTRRSSRIIADRRRSVLGIAAHSGIRRPDRARRGRPAAERRKATSTAKGRLEVADGRRRSTWIAHEQGMITASVRRARAPRSRTAPGARSSRCAIRAICVPVIHVVMPASRHHVAETETN